MDKLPAGQKCQKGCSAAGRITLPACSWRCPPHMPGPGALTESQGTRAICSIPGPSHSSACIRNRAHHTAPLSLLAGFDLGTQPRAPDQRPITGTELQAEAASRQASDAKGKGGAGLGVSLQNFRATASVTLEGSCHLQHFGVSLSLEAPNFGGPFESRRQHMTH